MRHNSVAFNSHGPCVRIRAILRRVRRVGNLCACVCFIHACHRHVCWKSPPSPSEESERTKRSQPALKGPSHVARVPVRCVSRLIKAHVMLALSLSNQHAWHVDKRALGCGRLEARPRWATYLSCMVRLGARLLRGERSCDSAGCMFSPGQTTNNY